MLLCLNAYSQKIESIGNGAFMIDRAYAETMAAKFDSLKSYKALYLASSNALDACLQSNIDIVAVNALNVEKINALEAQKNDFVDLNESLQRQVDFLESNAKMLEKTISKTEKRAKRQKFWTSFGSVIGGLAAGFVIGIIVK